MPAQLIILQQARPTVNIRYITTCYPSRMFFVFKWKVGNVFVCVWGHHSYVCTVCEGLDKTIRMYLIKKDDFFSHPASAVALWNCPLWVWQDCRLQSVEYFLALINIPVYCKPPPPPKKKEDKSEYYLHLPCDWQVIIPGLSDDGVVRLPNHQPPPPSPILVTSVSKKTRWLQ